MTNIATFSHFLVPEYSRYRYGFCYQGMPYKSAGYTFYRLVDNAPYHGRYRN